MRLTLLWGPGFLDTHGDHIEHHRPLPGAIVSLKYWFTAHMLTLRKAPGPGTDLSPPGSGTAGDIHVGLAGQVLSHGA